MIPWKAWGNNRDVIENKLLSVNFDGRLSKQRPCKGGGLSRFVLRLGGKIEIEAKEEKNQEDRPNDN